MPVLLTGISSPLMAAKEKKRKQTPQNVFRDAPEEEVKPKSKAPRPKSRGLKLRRPDFVKRFWSSSSNRKLSGLVLLVSSAFLFAACIEYLRHWEFDQSVLHHGADLSEPPRNSLGFIGAWLAHQCMFHGFGWSFLLIFPPLWRTALRWFTQRPLAWFSLPSSRFVFGMIWLSATLGLLVPGLQNGLAAGSLGLKMTYFFSLYAGSLGMGLLLLASALAYVVLYEPLVAGWLWRSAQKVGEEIPDEEESAPLPEVYTHRNAIPEDASEDEVHPAEDVEVSEDDLLVRDVTPNEEDVVETPIAEGEENEEPVDETYSPQEGETVSFDVPKAPPKAPKPGPEEDLTMEVEVAEAQDEVADLSEGESPRQGLDTGYDPTLDLSGFKFPPLDLLVDHGNSELKVDQEELEDNKNRIVETLRNYGVEIAKIKATIGPTVTLYEIVPAPGVRISKIKNLEDDIALSLAAHGIRIIAPIPGKGTIGIEVPNSNRAVVGMRKVMQSEKFAQTRFDLPIALGRTISNEVYVADLAKMPHLLVAGATGQGKSVGINALLVSLLYKRHPSELKFVMVDPKKVELTLYGIIEKHYLAKLPDEEEPIITDTKKVIHTLNSLCIEMDNRYELLKTAKVRNLKEYNSKFKSRRLNPEEGHRFLPYIVLVIDEFADLIMTAGKEVEMPIARIAQLARAVGIHLIIATQRPSVNIITGTIKANFPARLAFRVSSKVDSRTILDAGGAEQLIGQGDMLLSLGSDLVRLQCPFVDTPEVEDIVRFIGEQRGYPEAFLLPEYEGDEESAKGGLDPSEKDSLFNEAATIIVQSQQGSASLLQRKLNIGYNRAGRLIDQMEAVGIVGPNRGSKPREVLIKDEASLDIYLD